MTIHTTADYNSRSGAAGQGNEQIVSAVKDMDLGRRRADLEALISQKGSAAFQAEQKLADFQMEGMVNGIKKLGMGIQVVSSVLGNRSQKIMKVLGGVGQLMSGLGDSWLKSVNRDRTTASYNDSINAHQRASQELKSLNGFKDDGPPTLNV